MDNKAIRIEFDPSYNSTLIMDDLKNRGVEVASNIVRLHIILWFHKSRLESKRLFSVVTSLTPETKRVAINSQSNTCKSDDGKAFSRTDNEPQRNWRTVGNVCRLKYLRVIALLG